MFDLFGCSYAFQLAIRHVEQNSIASVTVSSPRFEAYESDIGMHNDAIVRAAMRSPWR